MNRSSADDAPSLDLARRPPSRWIYAATGALLGVGAPVGAFILRTAFWPSASMDPLQEVRANWFFYLYSLIGSCVVFATAAFVAGLRAERLHEAEAFYHRLSDHDVVTGLLNARAFQERYRRAIERAIKSSHPLTIMLLDIDRLKAINDQFGHEVGNRALIHVAAVVRKCKRLDDDAARWGGDEFAILLDDAGADAAKRVADDILSRLRQSPIPVGDGQLVVRVTIGIASAIPTRSDEDLFAVADHALYEGKEAGRDQWRIGQAVPPK